ncbi:MAG: hypothetical protein KDA36_12810, partial [Planctomycetaceae bacterium]|nr:hypothetical protein [Planctomycetaceae bacterium]
SDGTDVRNEAESNLRKLDFQMAVKHGLARNPGVDPDSCLAISRGWDLSLEWCDRPPVMGGASNKTLNKYKRSQVLHRNFCDMEGIHIGMTLEKMSWNGTGEVWEGDTRIAPCILS